MWFRIAAGVATGTLLRPLLYPDAPIVYAADSAQPQQRPAMPTSMYGDGVVERVKPGTSTVVDRSASGGDDAPPAEELPPVDPVKIAIVGGGFAGAKLASVLDSIFEVILIDTKNFLEFPPDLVPIITTPWSDKVEDAIKKYVTLHRFFLKRANVVTGRAVQLESDKTLVLEDGRKVDFDLLVMATGQEKAFPFTSKCRTMNQRKQEIKHMNRFIGEECDRIAVVGGGGYGCTTACHLAKNYPDKKVVLYHSGPVLLPMLPHKVRSKTLELLQQNSNLEVKLSHKVVDVERHARTVPLAKPVERGHAAAQDARDVDVVKSSGSTSWWGKLFGGGSSGADGSNAHRHRGRDETTAGGRIDDQFSVKFETMQGGEPKVNSVLHQLWFSSPPTVSTNVSTKVDSGSDGPFDYVFPCIGATPRNEEWKDDEILGPHLDATDRFRVSKHLQMLGHPDFFSIGAGNGLPFLNTYGNANIEARTVFRNFYSILTTPEGSPVKTLDDGGLVPHRMIIPRMLLMMCPDEAIGSTSWGGAVTGYGAMTELLEDRGNLLQGFIMPVFYKPHPMGRIRVLIDEWLKKEVTDVADFDLGQA